MKQRGGEAAAPNEEHTKMKNRYEYITTANTRNATREIEADFARQHAAERKRKGQEWLAYKIFFGGIALSAILLKLFL